MEVCQRYAEWEEGGKYEYIVGYWSSYSCSTVEVVFYMGTLSFRNTTQI
jgi:hypothetical protein